MSDPPQYRSYLLRIWPSGPGRWAVALEDIRTGERRGFASMAAALSFLAEQLPERASQPADRPPRSPGEPGAAP